MNFSKLKICAKCKEEKSIEDFYNNITGKDGKSTICKKCKDKYTKEYKKSKIKQSKICTKCKKRRFFKSFHNDKTKKDGKKSQCIYCISNTSYYKRSVKKNGRYYIKHSIISNIIKYLDNPNDFKIEVDDIIVPDKCPIFNIPLNIKYTGKQGPRDNSPSLFLLDESKGYVKDNFIITSYKANKIRKKFNKNEIRKVLNFLS